MKKAILLSIMGALLAWGAFAQAPQMFNYQGVARDAGGDVLSNQAISVLIRINIGGAVGPPVYTETHNVTTNQYGLFTLKVGTGAVLSGVFANIAWGEDSFFMEIYMDETGGENYQLMGTTQLISVPYSLYAEKSGDSHWEKVGDDLNYTGGSVGIGTDAPAGDLHIEGGYSEANLIISSNNKPRLTLSETAPTINGFYFALDVDDNLLDLFGQSGASIYGPHIAVNRSSTLVGIGEGLPINTLDVNGRAVIGSSYSGNNTAPADGLLVQGNVGIGTTSPGSKLHVVGTAATGQLATSSYGAYGSHTSSGSYGYLGGSNVGAFGYSAALYGIWGSTLNGKAVYGSVSGSGYAAYFDGKSYFSQPMGIGTTSPEAMLEIRTNQETCLSIYDSDGSNSRPGIKFRNNSIHFISGDDEQEEYFGFYSTFSSERNFDANLRVYGKAPSPNISWGKFIGLKHDGTDGYISTDAGDIVLQPAGGDVVIEGNLKTTQKTGYQFIPPSSFVPRQDGYAYTNWGTDLFSSQNNSRFVATVSLPHNAVIVSITVWLTDGSTSDATLNLMNRQLPGTWTTMGSVTSYGSISTLLTLTDNTITDATVDNVNKFYFMDLTLQSVIDFLGARIEYTYTGY